MAGAPLWLHGDLSPGNFFCANGRLTAIIDFGGLAVGHSACDRTIAWTFFQGPARDEFIAHVPVDEETWLRARGWGLWQSLIALARRPDNEDLKVLVIELSRL